MLLPLLAVGAHRMHPRDALAQLQGNRAGALVTVAPVGVPALGRPDWRMLSASALAQALTALDGAVFCSANAAQARGPAQRCI